MNSKTFLNDIHIYKQKNLKDKRYLVLHMMTQYFLKQMKILYKDAFFITNISRKFIHLMIRIIISIDIISSSAAKVTSIMDDFFFFLFFT